MSDFSNTDLNIFSPVDEEYRLVDKKILEYVDEIELNKNVSQNKKELNLISHSHMDIYDLDDFSIHYNTEKSKYPELLTTYYTQGRYPLYYDKDYYNNLTTTMKNKNKLNIMNELIKIKGLVIAGDSVLNLLRYEKSMKQEEMEKSNYIDMYCLNVPTDGEDLLKQKTNEIFETLVEMYQTKNIFVIRTKNIVSFRLYNNNEHIFQLTLKTYHSMIHLLASINIDCCCIAYYENKLHVNKRFRRAYITSSNLIDTTKQSATYEADLIKYASKGFSVSIPNLDLCRINFDEISEKEKTMIDIGVPDNYGLS